MVFRADGSRNVLLPASRGGLQRLSRGDPLHAGENRGGARSVHDVGTVVPAVYRLEALPCASRAWGIRVHRDDRTPGPDGGRTAEIAQPRGVASRQYHTPAVGVLHARRTGHLQVFGGAI